MTTEKELENRISDLEAEVELLRNVVAFFLAKSRFEIDAKQFIRETASPINSKWRPDEHSESRSRRLDTASLDLLAVVREYRVILKHRSSLRGDDWFLDEEEPEGL